MIIIPAIDIKGGRCVRLTQGRMDAETVYSDDPASVAREWASGGARLIHLVDLDGAIEGKGTNYKTITDIISAVDADVQIGGGIRDIETASRYLSFDKVRRVIIGTAACEDPGLLKSLIQKWPGRVAVGIDAKDGLVAIKGWVEVTNQKATELAGRMEGLGVSCIIYTDISRDGTLVGPNVEATKELAQSIGVPVVASGGISSLDDIRAYKGSRNIEGIIVGKALYAKKFTLEEAIKALA